MRRPSRFLAPLVGLLVALVAAPLPAAATGTITGCASLSVPGGYVLTQDVATASDTCFDITGPGVSLSLGGHTVTGNGFNVGVAIEPGATGARVQEGALTNFAVGVEDDASGAVVNDIAARGDRVGFQVGAFAPATGGVLSDDRATGGGGGSTGIELNNRASGVTVSSDTVSGNGVGIQVAGGSSGDRLVGNVASGNLHGIDIDGTRNQIAGNKARGNVIDLLDTNLGCDRNQWVGNTFQTSFPSQPSCIR